MEMSGDRCFGNDRALVGGFAQIGDEKVMIIGHQKGHDTEAGHPAQFWTGAS